MAELRFGFETVTDICLGSTRALKTSMRLLGYKWDFWRILNIAGLMRHIVQCVQIAPWRFPLLTLYRRIFIITPRGRKKTAHGSGQNVPDSKILRMQSLGG